MRCILSSGAFRRRDPALIMNDDCKYPSVSGRLIALIINLGVVALAWSTVIRILWTDWVIDPEYSYGFVVPLLALGLFWRRLWDMPALKIPSCHLIWLGDALAIVSALILAATIPMAEANPDWRILGVTASLAAIGISLGMILRIGGWRWLWHLIFPCGFFLVAVPWPRNIEQSVMSVLVSWNIDTTIETLHWLGYEAVRQGNLIVLQTGILGVEEACSGIRSLQGGLMVALFFGEYFRVSLHRRFLLLLVALLSAMFGNLVRSSILGVIASSHGMNAILSWHDPAGFLILLITLIPVVTCALCWRKKIARHNFIKAPAAKYRPLEPDLLRAFHLTSLLIVAAIIIFSIFSTEYWFRSHERQYSVSGGWDLRPRSSTDAMPVAVPESTLKLLFNPVGFSEKWIGSNGELGQVFYFRWPRGRIAVQSILAMHTPAVCLSNIGMKLVSQLAPQRILINGISFQFHSWLFEQNGHSVYVFNAMPLDVRMPESVVEGLDDSPLGRLRSLLAGLRNNGQRMIEVAFWNLPDEKAARDSLVFYLNEAMVKD